VSTLTLRLDGTDRAVQVDKLIMAGYTGRNRAAVQAHIDDLAAHGIPAPKRVPTLFACTPELLTTADEITVLSDATSGEAEFVLFTDQGELLIGVGSDHTDRQLEMTDIPRAKQLCSKTVSREVWRLADVADHWDELILRSWIGDDGPEVLYQEGRLAAMMTPADILQYVRDSLREPLGRAAVYSGTLPVLDGHFRPSPTFTVHLEDPRRGRTLRCAYRVRTLNYIK